MTITGPKSNKVLLPYLSVHHPQAGRLCGFDWEWEFGVYQWANMKLLNYIYRHIDLLDVGMELYPMLHWDQLETLQNLELMDVLIPSLGTGLVFQKQSNWVCVVDTGLLEYRIFILREKACHANTFCLISNMSKGLSIHS